MRQLIIAGLTVALAACGAVAPLPEEVFLRLAVPAPASAGDGTVGELRVAPIIANGLHKERALAYTRDDGHSLQLSHHELWIESPEQLLQQELATYLRGALGGLQVVTETSAHAARVVTGRITRFEQQLQKDGKSMVAGLELAVRDPRQGNTLFVKSYSATEPLHEATPSAIAQAMSRAVAAIFAAFIVDAGDTLKPPFAKDSAP